MKTFQQSKDKGVLKLEQVNLITNKQEKKGEANRQEEKKTDRQAAVGSTLEYCRGGGRSSGEATGAGPYREQVSTQYKYS